MRTKGRTKWVWLSALAVSLCGVSGAWSADMPPINYHRLSIPEFSRGYATVIGGN
jgi:hypothetical protein